MLSGDYVQYYSDGVLNMTGSYANGQKHGKWVIYNTSGKKHQSGYYIDGLKDGKWELFKDGKLDQTICYSFGVEEDCKNNLDYDWDWDWFFSF